jgi:hypothetical protein
VSFLPHVAAGFVAAPGKPGVGVIHQHLTPCVRRPRADGSGRDHASLPGDGRLLQRPRQLAHGHATRLIVVHAQTVITLCEVTGSSVGLGALILPAVDKRLVVQPQARAVVGGEGKGIGAGIEPGQGRPPR